MDFNTVRGFIVSLFWNFYEDLIKALYFGPLLEKKMSAATDRNERHRWSYMTERQLLRRLATMTNMEKVQSFIDLARQSSNNRLLIAAHNRVDELWDEAQEASSESLRSDSSNSMTTEDSWIMEKMAEIHNLLDKEGMTVEEAKKIIEDRIKRRTKSKGKTMRRKIRT